MNEVETKAGLPKTAGYLYAKRIGNQLFVSGQVPHDNLRQIIGENDPYKQAQQCLTNLDMLLKCHCFVQHDIQHLHIYVIGDRENLTIAWQAVQDKFCNEAPPATLLGVTTLGYEGQLVEIGATVVKDLHLTKT